MRLSVFSILPIFGLLAYALATPVAVDKAVVAKRQDYAAEASILDDLLSSVKQQTGAINATLAALPAGADDAAKSAASDKVNAAVQEITSLINGATAQAKALPAASAKARRQGVSVAALVAQISALLLELSGTLNGVIAALGLTSLLAFLNPLTSGLSGLILALEAVVDGLLIAVGVLLDGILTGLSVALAGLTL